MGGWPSRDHDGWEEFMETEWTQLYERATGKMARALGYVLAGESQEELDRIAAEDQRKAQEGLVELRSGEKVWFKPLEELTGGRTGDGGVAQGTLGAALTA